ncbi:hypothetical protein FD46_GL001582 [Liquorilactobacillus oeni DSM 19972]|uniref:N-acetyltransferase domain-containing protein n=1 Tax=Liquorilactobacillus oeni DSM 19972 TaxID=1423777 RepID=A0A0R1MEX4_9LACO|nr:hypothetical protein FD46_GL001582 [Liquorilactobacillus oeni DSM 19972]
MAEEFWGKGLGTETARTLIDYGSKTYSLKKIIGACTTGNIASKKILLNNGFHFIRQQDNAFQKKELSYALLYFEKRLRK